MFFFFQLLTASPPVDAVVAKDGSGDHDTISAAVAAAPPGGSRYIIHIKEDCIRRRLKCSNGAMSCSSEMELLEQRLFNFVSVIFVVGVPPFLSCTTFVHSPFIRHFRHPLYMKTNGGSSIYISVNFTCTCSA